MGNYGYSKIKGSRGSNSVHDRHYLRNPIRTLELLFFDTYLIIALMFGGERFSSEPVGDDQSQPKKIPGYEGPDYERESGVFPVETFNADLPSFDALAIFTAADKGRPMQESDSIAALAGIGLEGDRYAKKTGAYSGTKRIPDTDRQVSLISRAGIHEVNAKLIAEGKQTFTEAETRRNIVIEIDPDQLNNLVGKRFKVGDVIMEGVELCTPCSRPSKLSGKPEFEQAFENRGGLRARIITDGVISKHTLT